MERAPQRRELGFGDTLPFRGVDVWNAYELSWEDARGKPQVAIASFVVPAESPCIVESKSVKLYLTALNLTRFPSRDAVAATMTRDLSHATGAPVGLTLTMPEGFAALAHAEPAGESLDGLALPVVDRSPVPDALQAHGGVVAETLHTRLFRSVCPVTGQPDYASVEIGYRGPRIDPAGLLAVSRFVPPARGLSRALRRADLRRHHPALRARDAFGEGALHAPRRHRHQPLAHERPGARAGERADGAAVRKQGQPRL